MSKKKLFLITTLVLMILVIIRIVWIMLVTTPAQPVVAQGELDLRDWDFVKNPVITLDGEWEFQPYELMMQNRKDTITILKNDLNFIQVPGSWDAVFPEGNSEQYRYGSYRMRILMNSDNNEQSYSMRLPSIYSSSKVFVNGRLVGQKGQPSSSEDTYKTKVIPYSVSFTSLEQEIEIVIHAANNRDTVRSGMKESIKFGTEQAIASTTWFSIIMQLLVVIFLFIQAMYAIMLYLIGTRQRSLIYFAALLLILNLTVLLDDDRLLLNWVPLNYEWAFRILTVAFVGVCAFLIALVVNLLPEYSKYRGFRWFFIMSAAMAIAFISMPFSFVMFIGLRYFYVMILALILSIVLTMRSTMRGGQDVIYLFLAACIILLNGIGAIFKVDVGVQVGFYPVDFIVAFFIFSAFWFKQYFRISAQTKQLANKLQITDKRKDEFLANTSHELRNPLHGILNIAQNVLESDKDALSDKNVKNLELLVTVGRRMSFMLNDLLDLTRLKEQGIRLQTRSLSIQTLAAGVCDMLSFMTEGKPIQFVNRIPESFPKVIADENRLLQILFNLLHNAVKYTNEGTIMIEAHIEGDKARIKVTDPGMGMDLETQERIFQPYEQGDSSITAIGGGLGLGLSICKQLVELHDGVLEVASTPGQGSTFSFTLELSDHSMPHTEDQQSLIMGFPQVEYDVAATSDTMSSMTMIGTDRPAILAIDDDPINLKILVNILSLEHYEIVTVTSGKDALTILDSKEWDLIIADVMMPNMSGYELTRIIRERFTISELPVLLLTARSQPEDIDAGFRSGANDYVTKPVEAVELRSRVHILTELRRSIRERLRMEAAWLQAQIQPHFLFNTLNAVAALSDIDTSRMRVLLDVFGQYLRASFDFRNSDRVVSIDHELSLIRSYLFIERERFEERLEVIWEVDEGLIVDIPPLSIQPLVENAVRHGILQKFEGGKIIIRITDQGQYVEVHIEDNGVGMDEVTVHNLFNSQSLNGRSGIGLLNVDRRLKQIYGKGLQVQSVPGEGTIVSFIVTK